MFSLVVTLIAIALVAVLAFAGTWFGGEAFLNNQAKLDAITLTSQASQIYAASQMYQQDHQGTWPATLEEMRPLYLKAIPVPPSQKVAAYQASPLDLLVASAYAEGAIPARWELIRDSRGVLTFIKLAGAGLGARACQAVENVRMGRGAIEAVLDAPSIPVKVDPAKVYQCAEDSPDSTRNTYFWRVPGTSADQACDALAGYNVAKGTNFECGVDAAAAAVASGTPGYWVFAARSADAHNGSAATVANQGFSAVCPAGGVVLGAPQPASSVAQHTVVSGEVESSATYCVPVTSEEVSEPAEFSGFAEDGSGAAQVSTDTYMDGSTSYPSGSFAGTAPLPVNASSTTTGVGGSITVRSGTYFVMAGRWNSYAYDAGWSNMLADSYGTIVAAGNVTGINMSSTETRLQVDTPVEGAGYSGVFRTSQPFDTIGRPAPRPWLSGYWLIELYAANVGTSPSSGAINYGWHATCPAGAVTVSPGGEGAALAIRDPYNFGPVTGGASAMQKYCIPGDETDAVTLAGTMGSEGSGGTLIETPVTIEGQAALLTEGVAGASYGYLWSVRPSGVDPLTPWSELYDSSGTAQLAEMAYRVVTSAGTFKLYAGAYYSEAGGGYDIYWNNSEIGSVSWVKVGVSNKIDLGGAGACLMTPIAEPCWGGEGWAGNMIVVAPLVSGVTQPYHMLNGQQPAQLRLAITATPSTGAASGFSTTVTGTGLKFTTTATATLDGLFLSGGAGYAVPAGFTFVDSRTLLFDLPPSGNPLGWANVSLRVCPSDTSVYDDCAAASITYNGVFAVAAAGVNNQAAWVNNALFDSTPGGELGSRPVITGGMAHEGGELLRLYGGDLCGASAVIEADGLSYPGTLTSCNVPHGDESTLGMNTSWTRSTVIHFPVFNIPFTSSSATVTVSRGGSSIQMAIPLKTIATSPLVVNNRWQDGKYVVLAGGVWQDNNPTNLAAGLTNMGNYRYLEDAATWLETYSPDGASMRCTESALLYVADDQYTLDYNGGSKRNRAWLCETDIPPGSTLLARVKTRVPQGAAPIYSYSKWVNVATSAVVTFTEWPVWEYQPDLSVRVQGTNTWPGVAANSSHTGFVSDFPVLEDGRPGYYATSYNAPHATTTVVLDRVKVRWWMHRPTADHRNLGYHAFAKWPGDADWTPVAETPTSVDYWGFTYIAETALPATLPTDAPIQFKVVGPDGSEHAFELMTSGESLWSLPGVRDKPNILSWAYVSVTQGTGTDGNLAKAVLGVTSGIATRYWDSVSVGSYEMARVAGTVASGGWLYSHSHTDGLSSTDFHHGQALRMGGYYLSRVVWEYSGGWMTSGHNGAGEVIELQEPGGWGRVFRYTCTANGATYPAGWLNLNGDYIVSSPSAWTGLACR